MANQLGFARVEDMLQQMSVLEFNERFAHWLAYPWGDDWMRAGIIAAELRHAVDRIVALKTGHASQPVDDLHFVPMLDAIRQAWRDTRTGHQSDDELDDVLRGIAGVKD